MSYDHVYTSNQQYEEMKHRIDCNETYVKAKKERIAEIEALVQAKKDEIKKLQAENDKKIEASVNAFIELSRGLLINTEDTLNSQLQLQESNLEGKINDLNAAISDSAKRVDDVGQHITEIAIAYNNAFETMLGGEKSKAARAERILSELGSFLHMMEELEPARFVPDKYNEIIELREEIRSSIVAGDYDSALMVARHAVMDAARTLAELQATNEIYARRSAEVMERALNVKRSCELLSSKGNVLEVEIGGSVMEFDYDADFWTDGKISRAAEEFNERYVLLTEGKLDLQRLERIDGDLTVISNYLELHDKRGRKRMAEAVMAADAAKRFHSVMSDSNINIESSGYVDGDMRNPYAMSYSGPNDSKISVVIEPDASPSIILEVFAEDEEYGEILKRDIETSFPDYGMGITEHSRDQNCSSYTDHEAFVNYVVTKEGGKHKF